ncbi:MAG: rhamnulokinase, partial [Clostridiales bacterium]|nr:rhamnulokinase [Clostridiales bacterium]
AAMAEAAEKVSTKGLSLNVDHPSFLSPPHMGQALFDYIKSTGQQPPEDRAILWRMVFEGLAASYARTTSDLEQMNHTVYQQIAIVGGGSQNALLNQLTANACQKTVVAGPIEATALGNILTQMIAAKEITSYKQGRKIISSSFCLQTYTPKK